jgi:omega-6 fatty acid desaturase (delta-12 desaturase)
MLPPLLLMWWCQVFDINPLKAWGAVAVTLSSVAASLYLISVSPWYLLPFAWFIAGTAFTGVSYWSVVRMH